MADKSTIRVPVEKIRIRRRVSATLAIIGNPNSGKSTLFNRLTGLRQTTGNYPGVTVEKHSGTVQLESTAIELVDLPGIYCLGGYSADERIAVDVILGRIADTHTPGGLLMVLDATHLYQGLYLLQQLMEMQVPMIVALTMTDVATTWAGSRYFRWLPPPDVDSMQSKQPWKGWSIPRRPKCRNPGLI